MHSITDAILHTLHILLFTDQLEAAWTWEAIIVCAFVFLLASDVTNLKRRVFFLELPHPTTVSYFLIILGLGRPGAIKSQFLLIYIDLF